MFGSVQRYMTKAKRHVKLKGDLVWCVFGVCNSYQCRFFLSAVVRPLAAVDICYATLGVVVV